ncbi:hypothetical protein AL050_02910 [Pseudomonas syringae pv. daphniphylli]|nr:hypothetical protein AL050_02910 [Pseudomonas syringae pv. daphniphylli]
MLSERCQLIKKRQSLKCYLQSKKLSLMIIRKRLTKKSVHWLTSFNQLLALALRVVVVLKTRVLPLWAIRFLFRFPKFVPYLNGFVMLYSLLLT